MQTTGILGRTEETSADGSVEGETQWSGDGAHRLRGSLASASQGLCAHLLNGDHRTHLW